MATANQIIGRALRLIKVVAAGETVEASIAADALAVLNAMLAEWHEAGIGLPDYSFTDLTDTLASDAADHEAISYQLALRLAPEFEGEPSMAVAAMAQQTFFRLRQRYLPDTRPVPVAYY